MKRRAITWLLLFAIALPTLWQRQQIQTGAAAEEGVLARRDRPNALFGLLVFGGFRPVFLEYLWAKADALSREGRHWEVAEVFERISRLDPKNPDAWFNQAYWLVFNIAQREPEPAEKWRLYRRSLDHLAEGLQRHPRDERLLQLRFEIFFGRIARDSYLNRQCLRNLGRDGLLQSLDAAYAWQQAHPESFLAGDALRIAGEESAERLLNLGRLADAEAALRELARISAEMSERFPMDPQSRHGARIYGFWADLIPKFAASLGEEGGLGNETLLLEVEETLGEAWSRSGHFEVDPESELFDAAALAYIHSRIMALCQVEALAERPTIALRHLSWVGKLARLSDGRLGPRMPYYTEAYVSLFREVIELDSTWRSTDATSSAARSKVRARIESRLEALNRNFRERTGRDDPFIERYATARFAR